MTGAMVFSAAGFDEAEEAARSKDFGLNNAAAE
jgi:hypothetical protein